MSSPRPCRSARFQVVQKTTGPRDRCVLEVASTSHARPAVALATCLDALQKR